MRHESDHHFQSSAGTRYARWFADGIVLLLAGCLSPIALKKTITTYDQTVTEAQMEQLLLNIARVRHHHPTHFTAISNVAATFDFRVNAGATPSLGGLQGSVELSPIFGGSFAESPTISIYPVEGEEFTKRLLSPLDEIKFYFLARQGSDLGMLLRLLTQAIRLIDHHGDQLLPYEPEHPASYIAVRQRLGHLASLNAQHVLSIQPLTFERSWRLPLSSDQAFQALEAGYEVDYLAEQQHYALRKHVVGRVVITNYDPQTLSDHERAELHHWANRWPLQEIFVDIRPGFPGGDFPFTGTLKLRSFVGILEFLGRGIAEQPEYHVDLDPRTSPLALNPAKTLDIHESLHPPEDAL